MRIALGKLLLQEPSLLILDEPTNHLDVVSQHWLEHYLKISGSILIISHDRAFLESVTERTIELKMGILNRYKEITVSTCLKVRLVSKGKESLCESKKEIQKRKRIY